MANEPEKEDPKKEKEKEKEAPKVEDLEPKEDPTGGVYQKPIMKTGVICTGCASQGDCMS